MAPMVVPPTLIPDDSNATTVTSDNDVVHPPDPSDPSPKETLPSTPSSLPGPPVDAFHPPLVVFSTMSRDKVLHFVHDNGTSLPAIQPCDTPNNSNTKTHWSAEELHRTMGCRKFQNYKHILQVSRDGQWLDGGEFPPSLGSFATIPKAKHGQPLACTCYLYLDAVHMNIGCGDCLSVGGFVTLLFLLTGQPGTTGLLV
jgi:hypothetical protein